MILSELFQLSHRELAAHRTRSTATVVTMAVLSGLLLATLFIVQGLENVALRYAGATTDYAVFLASSYDDQALVFQRLSQYRGRLVTLTEEQKHALGETLPDSAIVAQFDHLDDAYQYSSKTDAEILHYRTKDYSIVELFTNQVAVYRFFRTQNQNFLLPACIVLTITSVLILAFTMAHLLASDTKTFMLYRSIGASRLQLLGIYFAYLLELCARTTLLAIAIGLSLAGIVTVVGWNSCLAQLTSIYPDAPTILPILFGLNWQCLIVIFCIFSAAPISFLLCLDQFSNRKIAQKLKGD